MATLNVNIGAMHLKNPIMTASGTFGYGLEYADFVPLDGLGGIIVKGTTLAAREGNDYPRMAETPSGMLNCVGLQNKGVDYFCANIYPQIKDFDTNMIVNVSGSSPDDYAECAARIDELDRIPAIELNISCPNVRQGGMAFGVTCAGAAQVVRAVRRRYRKTLIVKLSPNVTDITEIARVCEAEGADSVSLINTLMGMAIDIERRKPVLSIGTGGLSGPCKTCCTADGMADGPCSEDPRCRIRRHLQRKRCHRVSDGRRNCGADWHGQLPRSCRNNQDS